jgi:hypothetical protein
LLNKSIDPSKCKYQIVPATPLVFVDTNEDLVMADDVVTPSNPLIAPVKEEKFEETPLGVNVSQQSRDKESFEKVVRTRVDRLAWDRQLSPNPHALAIYLEFVPTRGAAPKRFEVCQCENDDVRLDCRTWVFGMAIIVGYEAQSTPFPWSIESNT